MSALTNQYFNFIKQAGYKYWKDGLGYYFDNGSRRFSVMKTGPIFQCYFNVKDNGAWVLKDKSNGILDFDQCLIWVTNNIRKSI
jgi:hypothetical protein